MTNEDIVSWFHVAFGIDHQAGSEIKSKCPKCGYENFYFNTRKNIGVCHKASCHYTPRLKELIKLVGYGPSETSYAGNYREPIKPTIITMPETAAPVIEGSEAFQYLQSRGLSKFDIVKFNIQYDHKTMRVLVPITDVDGNLVGYNSRTIVPDYKGKKYLYAPGSKNSRHIFGWAEARHWPRLTLVENTFVSIVLRDRFQCATLFGSAMSNEQADMIARSKAETVALIWDENTYASCSRALQKLHMRGIKAAFFHPMKGQPDDWSINTVEKMIEGTHKAAQNGLTYYSLMEKWETNK